MTMKKNVVCIIQARMGSTRLPGKVLLDLEGKPVVHRVVDRVLEARTIDRVVVAIPFGEKDDALEQALDGYHARVSVHRGSEQDVLDRYYQAARAAQAEIVVRVTCDCPVIDPEVIDRVVATLSDEPALDYAANVLGRLTYPDGLDVKAMTFSALEKTWLHATKKEEREHVTPYIRRGVGAFRTRNVECERDLSMHRWTLDEEADYRLLCEIYKRLLPSRPSFRMKDILELFEADPRLAEINRHVKPAFVV